MLNDLAFRPRNFFHVLGFYETTVLGGNFGTAMALAGINNVNINFTLIEFTQVTVERDSPVILPMTTAQASGNYIQDIDMVQLQVMGTVTVNRVDLNCE